MGRQIKESEVAKELHDDDEDESSATTTTISVPSPGGQVMDDAV